MIKNEINNYFLDSNHGIVIPANNISMVFGENNLTHALLILKESNYTQVPVLNYERKFLGLISIHHIYRELGDKFFEGYESLYNYKIKDFINNHYACLRENFELEEVLNLLVDYTFINIVDENNIYRGMITRSSILKKTNSLLHNIDNILK